MKSTHILIIFVLLVSFLAHAFNMFNFPYYENDEGVYMSQAWSILKLNDLAPYTYWYDHAPAGWVFIAAWLAIFKDLYPFGFSLNLGRVFMLVIHLASTWFVLQIGKKLTGKYQIGAIAAIIFSLSPLGIYYQRRILLDNMMIFWVLYAYVILLSNASRLSRIVVSGLLMGVAILTKENAVFFIPGFLVTIFLSGHKHHRMLLIIQWLFATFSIVSFYFLFALIKGELFPYGTPIVGGSAPHVSLLGSLQFQLSRSGGQISDPNSSFRLYMDLWLARDRFLILGGLAANILVFLYSVIKDKKYLGLSLLGLFFWWFLARGGIVMEFYILPIIPLLALYISIAIWPLINLHPRTTTLVFSLICIVLAIRVQTTTLSVSGADDGRLFESQQTTGQLDAVDWVRKYIPQEAIIITDNYMWLDLHDSQNPSAKTYPNAHWYWKVNLDPEVKNNVLNSDPSKIDYIVKTPQMESDLMMGASAITSEALVNSKLITGLKAPGWDVEIWATNYPRQILTRSWSYYKSRFLETDGRVIDPGQNSKTTSEGQAYALLRAVWENDRETFDKVWSWTKTHMQRQDGALSWQWEITDGSGKITDEGNASDAEVDAGMALILAGRRWQESKYQEEARLVVSGLWETSVKNYGGSYYLLPGGWATSKPYALVNPSYFSPAAFRMFAEIDTTHNWKALVDSSYDALFACSRAALGSGISINMPPNWCRLEPSGEAVKPDDPGTSSTDYSYEAVRVMWRVALDYKWSGDERALNYLRMTSEFLKEKWVEKQQILVGYTHSGEDWEKYESVVGYMAAVSNFLITEPDLARQIYESRLRGKFYEDFRNDQVMSYWEDPNNYYSQNWAWFATALYFGSATNKF